MATLETYAYYEVKRPEVLSFDKELAKHANKWLKVRNEALVWCPSGRRPYVFFEDDYSVKAEYCEIVQVIVEK